MQSLLSRRRLLLGATATAALVASDAWLVEPRWLAINETQVPLPRLGSAWHNATIALLSDTHCGPYTRPDYIQHAVRLTNDLHPDLVLLLGDYVHRGAKYIDPGVEPFASLQAREGVFAVLGNHDHWDGREQTLRALQRGHVETLTNRSIRLVRSGESLVIGGVGDFLEDEQLPQKAFRGRPREIPRILMSHNPDYAEHLPQETHVDLMVSGHTHGGQVHVPFYGAPVLPSRYGKKYQEGLVDGPQCKVFVTRGVSTISPPVRFLCRPEIAVLRLVCA